MELDPVAIESTDWDLTPEQWQQLQNVIDSLDRPRSLAEESERRDIERTRFIMPVLLGWSDLNAGEGTLWAMSHNLSRRGMGLVAKRMFRAGELITLRLPMPDQSLRVLEARVVFCRYIARMYHDVGLEFIARYQ